MILFLSACVGTPVITPSDVGCEDYDFDDPAPSALESTVKGDVAEVWRTGIERPNTNDVFQPDIVPAGNVVEVHEAWEAGDDATPICFDAHVTIAGFGAPIQVEWYTDDSSIPFDTVTVSPE